MTDIHKRTKSVEISIVQRFSTRQTHLVYLIEYHLVERRITIVANPYSSDLVYRAAPYATRCDHKRRRLHQLDGIGSGRTTLTKKHRLCISREVVIDSRWRSVSNLLAFERELIHFAMFKTKGEQIVERTNNCDSESRRGTQAHSSWNSRIYTDGKPLPA